MLDFEIAEMFDVETRVMNQAVKRNIERFPEDFVFRLTEEEWAFQRSQIVISSPEGTSQFVMSSNKNRGKAYLPYAFTEHGVTMLASVLRSERAVKVSIAVVRAFISLKKYISEKKNISKQLQEIKDELSERIDEQDIQIIEVYRVLDKLIEENSGSKREQEQNRKERKAIGFKQQLQQN